MYGYRLVQEASHGAQRNRLHWTRRVDRNLEDVPVGFVVAVSGPAMVSSHDSQPPQGVEPPVQLMIVPASDTNSSTSSTASSPSRTEIRTSSEVVPPLARLS